MVEYAKSCVDACRRYLFERAAREGTTVTVTAADVAGRFDIDRKTAGRLLDGLAASTVRVEPRLGADGYLVWLRGR